MNKKSNPFGLDSYGTQEVEYRGYTVCIEHDEYTSNPRRDCDWLGTLCLTTRQYRRDDMSHLSDEGWDRMLREDLLEELSKYNIEDQDPDEEFPVEWHLTLQRARAEDSNIILYVDYVDYGCNGGVVRSAVDDNPDGVLFVPVKTATKELGMPVRDTVGELSQEEYDRIVASLNAELEVLNHWLQGEVYYFRVYNADDDELDSCGGFYGDHDKSGLFEHLIGIQGEIDDEESKSKESNQNCAACV